MPKSSPSSEGLQRLAGSARLIAMAATLQKANADMALSVNRRLDAELCLLRLCDEGLSGDLDALNARIARLEELVSAGARFASSNAPQPPSPPPVEKAPAAPPVPVSPPVKEPEATDDYDAPPPYGEPIAPAQEETPAAPPEPPAPSVAAPARDTSPAAGADDELWGELMENYKNRLTPDKRAFIGTASGRLHDGVLTVYCATDVQKKMLDTEAVETVLREVTSAAVNRAVSIRFVVGVPEGSESRDRMKDLLQLGNKFDNFNIK